MRLLDDVADTAAEGEAKETPREARQIPPNVLDVIDRVEQLQVVRAELERNLRDAVAY